MVICKPHQKLSILRVDQQNGKKEAQELIQILTFVFLKYVPKIHLRQLLCRSLNF